MNKFEDNTDPDVDRRGEKRVTYTAILGFKEIKDEEIPPNPDIPNATGANLSLGGICFQSDERPLGEHLILYLPDGARAAVRVVNVTHDFDASKFTSHCEVIRWLPDNAKTLQQTPQQVPWPTTFDYPCNS